MPILKFILIAILYNQRKRKKKRNYNQHTMQVAQGNFSPLVFSIYRDMAAECQAFYSRLSELLAEKCDIHKSVMMRWIRSNLCFKLLKSWFCLRGSRSQNYNTTEFDQDIAAQYELCSIRQIHKLFNKRKIYIYAI